MLSVLVVDDEPNLRLLTRRMLTRLNCESIEASNGIQGEELALEHKPDLVLLDIMMPVQDGYETCAHLRTRGYNGVIILVSAISELEGKSRAAEIGANAYIPKPMTLDVLRLHLQHLQSYQTA